MIRKIIITAVVAAAVVSVAAQPVVEVSDPRILSFEESAAPVVALRGSTVVRSEAHYKHGMRSLRWQWRRDGAQLRLEAPINYLSQNPDPNDTSISSFVFWLYAPEAVGGELRFEFRKKGRRCAWFDYGLNFSGWRGAWVAFDRDMQGTPEEGMDELVITVNGARHGELFFDHFILASFQDVRYHTADLQAPFINAATDSHWLVLLRSWRNPMPKVALTVSDAERQGMATVEKRLRERLLEDKKPQPLVRLRDRFAQYNIRKNTDGTLCGKPIWFERYAETYLHMGHSDVKRLYAANDQTLRGCNDLLFQLAVAYDASRSDAERSELARMYLLLTRHLLDQGFAAGSAQGTLHHLGYSMRNFYTAPIIMREELRRAGLESVVQQAMEWFSGVGEVKLPPAALGMDIDAFNTSLIGRLASIIMLPDSPKKVAYLAAFSRWVDNGYKITEGTSACFKSDGTVFHHRHHYPAYAVGGFDGGVDAVWLLARTPFAVSAESHAILKRALLEMRFYCNLRSFPLAMSGRHPDGLGELVPWHYARLALAGSPDGTQDVDRELAAAYLRVVPDETRYTRMFSLLGIAPESAPEGCRVYGYNASLSYRRGDWLLTVAGHSRYIWSAEIYQGANHYGRYLTFGSMQLLGDGSPIGSLGSGFRQPGWDWRYIPATTALVVPMERMKADIRNVDTCSGYEEMLLSDETFAGGVSYCDRDGLYALKLHDHDKYNGTLRARKSYFLFGNRVVALGSDIENMTEDEVHTTLFQNYMEQEDTPMQINGTTVVTFPYHATLDNRTVLIDNLRNAYFIPQGEVRLSRERQHSLDEETDAPTENNYMRASIYHGTVFRHGGYEYMQVVHASDADVTAYMRQLPYEVLQRDSMAHIVRDRVTETIGYALFEAGEVDQGLLLSVSKPALVMIGGADNALTVSLSDPDLRFYEGPADERLDANGKRIERSIYSRAWIDRPSQPSAVRLTLRGEWRIEGDSSSVRVESVGGNTELTVTCREGATRQINLIQP